MLQAYSSNLTVPATTPYAFNSDTLRKGCTAVLVSPSTIQLNKRGIYLVECDGFATPAAATDVSVQLYQNGVARPDAISTFTGVADTANTFGFKAYVMVAQDNCCNSFNVPTTIQVMNGDTDVTDAHINICVSKIC